jgi:bifunctional enzyme CysN/CysC
MCHSIRFRFQLGAPSTTCLRQAVPLPVPGRIEVATAFRPIPPDPAAAEIDAWLLAQQEKSLLRFITCGSVDDGKSTLIGRLLYDSKMLFEDQLAVLESDSRRSGAAEGTIDFSLLVDGLAAEREQGITIDVAYRFFATERRKFVVADTPGHEQYTRNMATGASTAEAAVILIDARKGVLTQTRRHSHIAHLLGIRSLILAVNKMDLVGYDQARFEAIVADYRVFADEAGIGAFTAIPVSGLEGDNVSRRSARMPWHGGPSLLEALEQAPVRAARGGEALAFPVQWVNRPDQGFRGYAGTIAAGRVRPGDRVRVLPSGEGATVARIVTLDGDLAEAAAGQAVTLTFTGEVDCARGDLIAADDGASVTVADHLDATLVWMAAEPLVPGRAYWLKLGPLTVAASVARVAAVRDVNTMAEGPGRPLGLNDIGRCEIVLDRPIPAALYRDSRALGGFILIDRASHATLAAGLIDALADLPAARAAESGQGRIIWLTGSSDEERSRFARKARERFAARGRASVALDETSLRDGLNSDLGEEDEAENRRRTLEVAKLLSRAGVTVLVALEAPEGAERPGTEVDVGGAAQDWDWII